MMKMSQVEKEKMQKLVFGALCGGTDVLELTEAIAAKKGFDPQTKIAATRASMALSRLATELERNKKIYF